MTKAFESNIDLHRQIVESAEDGVWLIDAQGVTIFANNKMASILGYTVQEMMGKTMYDFMDDNGKEIAEKNLNRRKEGISEQHDFAFRKKDGSLIWTTIAAGPFHDKNGNYIGALGIISDVTLRRKTEAMLKAQRNIFEKLMSGASLSESLNELMLTIEQMIDGAICSVLLLDEEGKRLWKGSAPNLPEAYNNALHGAPIGPDIGSCGTSAYSKKLVIVSDIENDYLWRDYKGLAAQFDLKACWSSPILNTDGNVLGTFAVYFKTVRAPSESELQIVRDTTSVAAVAIAQVRSREFEIQQQKMAQILAEARKTLSNTLDSEIVLQTIPQIFVPLLGRNCDIYLTGDNKPIPSSLQAAFDGNDMHLGQVFPSNSVTLSIPLTARGKILGGIVLDSPTSNVHYSSFDLKLASELAYSCAMALDNACLYEEAQRSIRAREEFISVASHEFRTPLTILKGRMDLITLLMEKNVISESLAERIRPTMDSVQSQLKRFTKLIENLLDVSKAKPSEMVLQREELSLTDLVHDQLQLMRPEFSKKNCSLLLKIDNDIKGYWDRMRLEQMVTNLLSNALKFGEGKPIQFTLESKGSSVRLEIADQGIGISPDDQERIFNRFERAVSDKNFGGLGLGLYISKQIILAHGGSIRVESGAGQGARFIIELPVGAL